MSLFKKKWKKKTKEIMEEEDGLQIMEFSDDGEEGEKIEPEKQPAGHKHSVRRLLLILIGMLCVLTIGGLMFLYLHVGTEYQILQEEERSDISGTQFAEFSEGILKYSSDGVSYLDHNGTVQWSSTFTMQSPVIHICQTTAVIADRKGSDVYVFNKSGLKGQFETSLPIEKVRVSGQGVVAAVLEDGDITWINLYDTGGNEIATVRTSLQESGYPLDVAISPDGLKIMVSYLSITQGVMDTQICYYNFDSVGQAEINNQVANSSYENAVTPEIFFADDETSVALRDNGFSIFKGKQIPELKKEVSFEEEVLGVFHNDMYMGFIFTSDQAEYKYRLQIYNMSGKQMVKTYFDLEYTQAQFSEKEAILSNEKSLEIYSTGGKKKFSGNFEQPIQTIIRLEGFRKYMVITQEKMYMIRLK